MNRHLLHRIARPAATAALAFALAAPALAGCQEPQDQREIELLVDDLAQALEERDVRGLLRNTTDDFLLFPGRLDKVTATKRAFLMFRLKGGLEALYPRLDVERDGDDAARVSGHFLLVRPGQSVPVLEDLEDDPDAWLARASELGEVTSAELSLIRRGDRWLVQTARFF